MKKITILISVILFGGCLLSCESQLDIPQKSTMSTEDFYANAGPDEAEGLIAAVYKSYYNGVENEANYLFLGVLSDDCGTGGQNFTDGGYELRMAGNMIDTPNSTAIRNSYANFYRIIYYCNMILERVPDSDDPRVKRVKAEANFMRALVLFEAIRWYGTPPFVTNVITTDEDRQMPNGDPNEMIPWIVERMQEAADALPAIDGIGQQQKFGSRISKHAALAYKAKVELWYDTRFNKSDYATAAVNDLKTVIGSGLYGLMDDMNVFDLSEGDFCKEYVFEHNSADADGYPSNQSHMLQVWTSWNPQHIYIPKGIENMGWGWAPPSGDYGRFMEKHDGINSKRFKSTILTYEQLLDLEYNDSSKKGLMTPEMGIVDNEGYFRNRYILRSKDVYPLGGFYKYTMTNMHYMRYAEVLLMYAEAKFLADNDSDGKGLEALNQVRVRAGITPLSTMSYQDIKDERRAELWFEGERFFDLVRWGDAPEVLKDKGKTWYSFHGYKSGTTEWDIRETPGQGNGWNPKYMAFSFPEAQLAANPNLKQNPGW